MCLSDVRRTCILIPPQAIRLGYFTRARRLWCCLWPAHIHTLFLPYQFQTKNIPHLCSSSSEFMRCWTKRTKPSLHEFPLIRWRFLLIYEKQSTDKLIICARNLLSSSKNIIWLSALHSRGLKQLMSEFSPAVFLFVIAVRILYNSSLVIANNEAL